MPYLILTYFVSFSGGTLLGYFFPTLLPTWLLLLLLLMVALVIEIVGRKRFDDWWDYRPPFHVLGTGGVTVACIGVLLGSGRVGEFLVWTGNTLSR